MGKQNRNAERSKLVLPEKRICKNSTSADMCTIIVTIRSVLWAVMTIAASLMILVSIFTDQWLIGPTSQLQTPYGPAEESMGLFGGTNMCQPMENMLFEGECVPDFEKLKLELLKEEETVLPHAWKGGIACMVVGLIPHCLRL